MRPALGRLHPMRMGRFILFFQYNSIEFVPTACHAFNQEEWAESFDVPGTIIGFVSYLGM